MWKTCNYLEMKGYRFLFELEYLNTCIWIHICSIKCIQDYHINNELAEKVALNAIKKKFMCYSYF